MKSFETTDSGGRIVCKEHGLLRCSECAYIAELESEVFRLQGELAGDGVLTLAEQVSHYKAVSERLQERNNLANELLDEVEDELIDLYLAETDIYTKINEFLFGSDSDD